MSKSNSPLVASNYGHPPPDSPYIDTSRPHSPDFPAQTPTPRLPRSEAYKLPRPDSNYIVSPVTPATTTQGQYGYFAPPPKTPITPSQPEFPAQAATAGAASVGGGGFFSYSGKDGKGGYARLDTAEDPPQQAVQYYNHMGPGQQPFNPPVGGSYGYDLEKTGTITTDHGSTAAGGPGVWSTVKLLWHRMTAGFVHIGGRRYRKKHVVIIAIVAVLLLIFFIGLGAGVSNAKKKKGK